MPAVEVRWYDGLENYMSVASSDDPVLAAFCTIREWTFVRAIYDAVFSEENVHLDESGFEFDGETVTLYNSAGETEIDKYAFFRLVGSVYDVLIEGANEDHHSVRYEPWWQDFIDKFFLLQERCKIATLQAEEEIVTLRVSRHDPA